MLSLPGPGRNFWGKFLDLKDFWGKKELLVMFSHNQVNISITKNGTPIHRAPYDMTQCQVHNTTYETGLSDEWSLDQSNPH
jgi:hypothetical protein